MGGERFPDQKVSVGFIPIRLGPSLKVFHNEGSFFLRSILETVIPH